MARDPDQRSDLHYSFIGAESFDETGTLVSDFNATASFVVNEISGDVFVVGVLDREVVERVRLFVTVEDFAAETEQQVTTCTSKAFSKHQQSYYYLYWEDVGCDAINTIIANILFV